MQAEDFLTRWSERKGWRWTFYALCLFPIVAGVAVRVTHHGWVLMDIDAVLCAAHNRSLGLSPYIAYACPGLKPAPYVYAPQMADMFAPLTRLFTPLGARTALLWLVIWPATAFLVWFALRRPMARVAPAWRWLAFSGLTFMTFCCGNIGLVMHAMVLLSLFARRRWPFIAVVIVCAAIKPTFLAYLLILLLEEQPRWRTFGLGLVAGLAVVAATVLGAGAYGPQWHDVLHATALRNEPGLGWFALTAYLGLACAAPLTLALTVLYMAAITGSALALARWGGLTDEERLLVGLGVVPLLTPRLMDYDMILIVPYAALLSTRYLPGRLLPWLFAAALGAGIVANLVEFKPWHRTHVAMFVFSSVTLFVGARLAINRFAEKKNEEGGLRRGGKGEILPRRKALVGALFNPGRYRRP